MLKKAYFFIDDVIWVFRDLAWQRPASLFDNPYMAGLKKAHDLYGMKVQLNVFYRTDFYYGRDEFTLAEMTDAYKKEFEEAASWLKLGFHARQEFPDYPYVNADYEDVKFDLDRIYKEICRFAGEESFAHAAVPHWAPISKDGCRALRDGGIKLLSVSTGERGEYDGNPASLPYGHAGRLLQNRKPETGTFTRQTRDVAIQNSICGYNHMSEADADRIRFNFDTLYDAETDMHFKKFCNGPCLNLVPYDELEESFDEIMGKDYICYALHEQYFYSDYYAYQPDYMDKILFSAKKVFQNGYTYFFVEELVK